MAEARREEQATAERRVLREVRSRGPGAAVAAAAADQPERTKPDHLLCSQGPLSSIRAAIKRTKTNSQSDHTRDRRRPEITIVSAEPLASNNWFPRTSVVFSPPALPPPPPPPQSGWSAGIRGVSQPPPSYDQVVQEKTQEEHTVRPTAAPRRITCTTTSATQTDPVREDHSTAARRPAERRPAGKQPKKPPRPSLPKPVPPADEGVRTNTADQSGSKSDVNPVNLTESSQTCTRSVTVHWDFSTKPLSVTAAEAPQKTQTTEPEQSPRPVPRPRTKSRKPTVKEEVTVHTLVKINENGDDSPSDPVDEPSNKYLEELSVVFCVDNQCDENSNASDQSDEALPGEDASGEMNTSNSHRNIRARIQAFESQAGSEEGIVADSARPEPLPRRETSRPPVAAKPSVALKPQFNHSTDDNNQNVPSTNFSQNPTPAPRPQPPKKPVGLSIKQELEALHNKGSVQNRARPQLTRAASVYEEEAPAGPPVPPVKPAKEPLKPNLNINNHNSTSVSRDNEYVDSTTNTAVVKPQHSNINGGSFTRQSVTRRPTTIRVPSRTGSLSDPFQDSPPPLPTQKPVGNLNASVNNKQSLTPILPLQESSQFRTEPSLPPRRANTIRSLPPRPPPAKTGPGRPPPPSLQATGRSHSAPWDVSPRLQAQKPHRKGPVLPPRPSPGHRLYNKYTLQLSHGIAVTDYNGSHSGELSFQKNEVLLLLKDIDHNAFECQVGDTRGRVQKSQIKVITPLDSVSHLSPHQGASPAGSGGAGDGCKAQAIHDFYPEGPAELGLTAGDVVTMVEQVDSDWCKGTCRGATGFFPTNYVTFLANSPKPLPERKPKPPAATVSGPRCVARFDFEGEHSDELSFYEGDVIQLKALVGQDWAQGQIGTSIGIFPLNFVEVIEDLPLPTAQHQPQSTGIALPGMAASTNTHPEVAKPAQGSQSVEWVVALYDFAGNTDGDLSFQQGDCILVSQHIDAEWSRGRLNGREGMFPRAYVESTSASEQSNKQQSEAADSSKARALYNFTSDCEEELSFQVGDIITSLESIDEEWFLGDLRGKRALVPKNYVQVVG